MHVGEKSVELGVVEVDLDPSKLGEFGQLPENDR